MHVCSLLLPIVLVRTVTSQTTTDAAPATQPEPTFTAPAPAPTTSYHPTEEPPFKPEGTCCKVKGTNGECADLSGANVGSINYQLYFNTHTPYGDNTWCGVDFCGCGEVNACINGATDCGYNAQTDSESCHCAGDCELDSSCCLDFETVCSYVAPAPSPPVPAPIETTTVYGWRRTTQDPDILPADPDNQVAIIVSVTVVVIVVVVVVVIFSVRHIKQRQANSRPLFDNIKSTTNFEGSPTAGGASPTQVELSVSPRQGTYAPGGKRGSNNGRKQVAARSAGNGTYGASAGTRPSLATTAPHTENDGPRIKKPSRQPRHTPNGKTNDGGSPVQTTTHVHDDVFASPTHHNFEL